PTTSSTCRGSPTSNRTFASNCRITASRSAASWSSAAAPASCTNGGTHDRSVLIILPIRSHSFGEVTANPSRQPLMLYDLLNVYAATHRSVIPGSASRLWCDPSHTMWQYGSSQNTATPVPRTRAAIPSRSALVATPPAG